MDKTQRLLGLALAVIALDGCRPASPDANATPSPGSPTVTHVGRGMSGGAAAAVIGGRERIVNALRGEARGLFGSSGFHGGG